MTSYRLSPYVRFVESKLIPEVTYHGAFHQLTGEFIQPLERVRALLLAAKSGTQISLSDEDLNAPGPERAQIQELVKNQFLIPNDTDPLSTFLNHYVVRPIQNPAIAYLDDRGDCVVVRTSMKDFDFSPQRGQQPKVIEELLPSQIARVLLLADGALTLVEIFRAVDGREGTNLLEQDSFREAIGFLTHPERQLIKFSAGGEDLDDPLRPCNTVPRNLYQSAQWPAQPTSGAKHNVDFHVQGIQDAAWEFDVIEPTLNHAFRFPSEVLGGYDYGSRFCLATLTPDFLSTIGPTNELSVLEVGGGTGSFARSFMKQALQAGAAVGFSLSYNILELSPVLARHQRELLSQDGLNVTHFEQDATKLNLPGRKFELIVTNEVIADFPVAPVWRAAPDEQGGNRDNVWEGEGAAYLKKFDLEEKDAPQSFIVNTGVFEFLEKACLHLAPGGTIIMSEYGSEDAYPSQAYNLNHEEFSINFRHVKACAAKLGLDCTVIKLKNFLEIDDEVLMLNGAAEHLQCLNHVLERHSHSLPYAAISKKEFEQRVGELAKRIGLVGFSFSALRARFHYGPDLDNFLVAIMRRPEMRGEVLGENTHSSDRIIL